MKVTFYSYMQNGGDGSAFPKFFSTREAAEAYAESDDERFCDDIEIVNLIIDDNGKLLNHCDLDRQLNDIPIEKAQKLIEDAGFTCVIFNDDDSPDVKYQQLEKNPLRYRLFVKDGIVIDYWKR